jgi:uncharacterized membrane protein YeaQ/YmgE (transglycosylase-associated protein family)
VPEHLGRETGGAADPFDSTAAGLTVPRGREVRLPPVPTLQEDDVIGAIILGILAGFIGKALMPGDDPGGFFVTILIGLAGALVGFFIFTELLGIGDSDAFDLGGLPGAVIGTLILLFIYRKVAGGPAGASRTRAGY